MVHPHLTPSFKALGRPAGPSHVHALWVFFPALLFLCAGCALAPRAQVDECQKLSRTLRSENAHLKDQLLVLQTQNRDYADRALDDSRRLVNQDEAIERLESSVLAYQDERNRLESAFHQLASSLGETRAQADDRLSHASPPAIPEKKPRGQSAKKSAQDREDQNRVR